MMRAKKIPTFLLSTLYFLTLDNLAASFFNIWRPLFTSEKIAVMKIENLGNT